jgi:AraC family cel operon transcriptional repressor
MSVIRLTAASTLDPQTEAHYARLSVNEIATQKHDHDFCEFFLVVRGNIQHIVNGETIPLREGSLVFIRPRDQHYFQRDKHRECQIINLALFTWTMESLFDYLGREQSTAVLLAPALPPVAQLSEEENNALAARLEALNGLPRTRKPTIRLTLRALLVEMCVDYFLARSRTEFASVPHWLAELCTMMQMPERFIVGREALLGLANRSPEHVGRAFKKHLGITPSQYVNTLRLNYAANLLVHTDHTVLDIALDSGFDTISHFNHLFRMHFHTAPTRFRAEHSRRIIP